MRAHATISGPILTMPTERSPRVVSWRRVILLVAAVTALAVDAAYFLIIRNQSGLPAGDEVFFASYVGVAGLFTLAATVLPVDARLPLQGVAATALLATGFLGMLSIGLPLFVAGVLVTAVTTYDARGAHEGALRWAAFSGVGALALLAVGIALL